MIEKVVLDYLNDNLSVSCFMQEQNNPKPSDNPKKFVVIEKTGSSEENKLCEATIAIQSYAGSLYETATLNEEVKEVMENIITLNLVSSCRLNSDYNFTDTSTKQPRYQAVFDLKYYKTERK